MVATHVSKEVVWLKRLGLGIGFVQQVVRLDSNTQSTIFLAKNFAYHSKKKCIGVQYHFVRDMVEYKKVLLVKVGTLNNIADSLKKNVSSKKFSWCIGVMAIVSLNS
jgi:hypothetical protein